MSRRYVQQLTDGETVEEVFLVSDNRRFPYDSRRFGSLDAESCKESIFFRLVSKNGFLDVKPRFTYIR